MKHHAHHRYLMPLRRLQTAEDPEIAMGGVQAAWHRAWRAFHSRRCLVEISLSLPVSLETWAHRVSHRKGSLEAWAAEVLLVCHDKALDTAFDLNYLRVLDADEASMVIRTLIPAGDMAVIQERLHPWAIPIQDLFIACCGFLLRFEDMVQGA